MNSKQIDSYVANFLSGDKDAFDIIYYETKKHVYLSIYAIIKDRFLIEDLMQDTYMKIINELSSYRLGTNFYAWVSRIARNTAINEYNRRKKIVLVEEYFDGVEENENTLLHMTMKVLDGLERDVLIYHTILNMRFKDIATMLEKPLPTIYSIYKKAIKTMKHHLGEEVKDEN